MKTLLEIILTAEQEQKLSPSQQLGEDIRMAKFIFEDRFGEQSWNDVNLWLSFANEVREQLKLNTIQETFNHLRK
jgi:hypothetical protein